MLELAVNINAFQHGRLMLNEKLVHSSNHLMESFYLFAWLDPGGDFLFYFIYFFVSWVIFVLKLSVWYHCICCCVLDICNFSFDKSQNIYIVRGDEKNR